MPYKTLSKNPSELDEVIREVKQFLQSEHDLQLLEQKATDFIFPANAALRDVNKEQHRQQCLIELNDVGVLLSKKNNSILEFLVKTYIDWLDSGKRISKATLASSGIIKRGYKILLDGISPIMVDPTDKKACYFNELISNLQQGQKNCESAEKKHIDRMRNIGVDYLELERKNLEEYLMLCKEPACLLSFSKGKESEQKMFFLENEKQSEQPLEVYNKCGNRYPKIG